MASKFLSMFFPLSCNTLWSLIPHICLNIFFFAHYLHAGKKAIKVIYN